MVKVLVLFVGVLLWAGTARAQGGDDWVLAQRDKDAIGIIEIRIGAAGLPTEDVTANPERATGVIISGAGHVLTAAHILSAEDYAICARADGGAVARRCRITFLWRGDRANTFELTIASPRLADRDYLVLKLPAAADKINRPTWPLATLARRAADGEAIYATGYPGVDEASAGTSNTIDTFRGSLRADMAESCSNSYGIARNASVVSAPGLSGGPVFNRLHRVVGIVLGEACVGNSGTVSDDKPRSRVLLVQDLPNLCPNPGFSCFYGYDGDIDAAAAADLTPWYKRLVSGEAVADRLVYGWKLRSVARQTDYRSLCTLMQSDVQLVQTVESDADDGSQLATIYAALWAGCRPGAGPADVVASRERVERLADAGYEPAQYFIAAVLMNELSQKLAARQKISDPLLLSVSEQEKLKRAEALYRLAAPRGWSAASADLFKMCMTRVYDCSSEEMESFLDQALADGQLDALRFSGIAHLIGDSAYAKARYGFTRAYDPERAIALFKQAATPVAGTSKNPNFAVYDNMSAGYLAYFYYGGAYKGKALIPANLVATQGYVPLCLGGGFGANPMSEFCGMIDNVGRFNSVTDPGARAIAWSFIQQYIPWAQTVGPLARNLATWSKDGADITRVSCDLDETLQFKAPATPPPFVDGVAYCYFPNVSSGATGATVSKEIFLIDSDGRGAVIDDIDDHLDQIRYPTKQPRPLMRDWIGQAQRLGQDKPAVIVIHLHSLRPEYSGYPEAERYRLSEMSLLDGLGYIHEQSPRTRFVLWSRSFAQSPAQSAAQRLQPVVDDLAKVAPSRRPIFDAVLRQSLLLQWPDKPRETDYIRLRSSIDQAFADARR